MSFLMEEGEEQEEEEKEEEEETEAPKGVCVYLGALLILCEIRYCCKGGTLCQLLRTEKMVHLDTKMCGFFFIFNLISEVPNAIFNLLLKK